MVVDVKYVKKLIDKILINIENKYIAGWTGDGSSSVS